MKRLALLLTLLAFTSPLAHAESVCFGTTSDGRLEGGVRLPSEGANFVSYGAVPEAAGRTYVHSRVADVVVAAYRALESEQPAKVFKYAETGFATGGAFAPHKTHRNGLSVDFMVPVVDRAGRSVHLPTHALNRYRYDIEFDANGRFGDYAVDYEALSAHIVALDKAARAQGIGVWRVIFDPALAPRLYRTKYGEYVRRNIRIPTKRSWVRHDEHYHVDFKVPCRK